MIAGFAAVAMIMLQFTVAAEACMRRPASVAPTQAATDAAPCHDMEGGAPPDRCLQRCDAVKHSPDHPPSLFVPVLMPIHPVRPATRGFSQAQDRTDSRALLTRATAPPLAVRNCCFRT